MTKANQEVPFFFLQTPLPVKVIAALGQCNSTSPLLETKKNEAQKRRKSRKGELVCRPQPRALRREHLGMYRAPQDVTKKC